MLLAGVFFTPAKALAQDTTGVGAVAGIVTDVDDAPAVAVTVCLVELARCELTGPDGRFALEDVRPGRWRLTVTPPGLPTLEAAIVEVRAGLEATIEVRLPRPAVLTESVTVTAPRFVPPGEIKTSGYLVQPAEILSSAGALEDVSRYLQALPGVVPGTNDFRNDLIVRGGSPLENLFVVDNVEIPNINAFANFSSAGGTVALLDAALTSDVTFLTGGFPAPYGNRVSSVLQVTQREGRSDRIAGQLTLGFAGAGLVAEGPFAGGNGTWIASLRRSFLDLFTDDIGIGGVPVLYTFNGKAVYNAGARDRIWFVNVSGVDRIRLGLTDETELDEPLADFDIRYRGWRAATGFNWQRVIGDRAVGLLGVTHSSASVESTVKDLVRDGVPPPGIPTDEVVDQGTLIFREGSREGETTLKYDLTMSGMKGARLQVGGHVKVFQLDYDTGAPVGNDSPFSLEPGANPFALDDRFTTTQLGAYAQATMDLTSRVNVTAGARVDRFGYLDATRLAPRAGISVRFTETVSWRAAAGRYTQQPPFLFLAAFPENASLAPIRADHYVSGITWQPGARTRLSLEAYHKRYEDYPVSSQFPTLSLANVGDTFDVRQVLFPMIGTGRGRATGIELLAERKPGGRWFGVANVSAARARHAGLDGVLRPGSYDYPRVVNLDGGWRLREGWQLSTRMAWLGGRPFTPFDERVSAMAGRGIYDLEAVNARRTPDYFRLDVRVERRFGGADRPLVVYAGLQNVTNRQNVAGYTWSRRLGGSRVQEQRGLFPILGFDFRF